MAPEDRDSIFEKALARHLRARLSSPGAPREAEEPASAAGASAGRAQEFSADAACPNPEVLAAYHERLLAPEEMASLKGHIAACDRCQEILATLEATDDLLLPSDRAVGEHDNIVTMPAPHVEIPAEIAAASATGPVQVPSRSARRAQSSWRSKTLRGANWKWLAPAGAIAAIVLLWVGFHESHPPAFELAKNTQPAAAPPVTRSETAAVPPAPQGKELADRAKSEPLASPRSPAPGPAREETRKRDQVFLDEKKSVDAAAGLHTPPPLGTTAKRVVPQATTTVPAAPQRDSRESGLTVQSRNDAPAEFKESAAPAPPPGTAAGLPARGYAGSAQKQDRDKDASVGVQSEAAAPSRSESAPKAKIAGGRQAPEQDNQRAAGTVLSLQAQTTETVTSNKNKAMLRVAKISSANVIAAPNNAALWRASPAGIVERSTDAGATWAVQSSGVVSDLLTGSAPSAEVCWIVGRNGTVVRTTDAGAHWEKLNAPATDDLTSIFAVDAQQATVSTTAPRRSYRTTDAGKTWTQLPTP